MSLILFGLYSSDLNTVCLFPSFSFTVSVFTIVSLKEQVEATQNIDRSVEILIRLLCAVPGWNEKNVQVQQQVIEVTIYIASTASKFPKKCVVLCICIQDGAAGDPARDSDEAVGAAGDLVGAFALSAVGGLIPSWITKAGDVHDSVLHCTCFATSVTEDGSAVTTLAPRILLRRCCCGAGAEELNLLSQLMLSHCCCGIY
ncbi:hypothetical protein POM88_047485 [Heracleum sosnowskyi]|uniref:Uncharacterized protein n=1 Tax=Heracleum sosnowskyi TaxID=360622 RepID=A0AAD8LZM4_9APIA|nr:hypothetical protein POM88_047485 [Heracleum sosnowskyi]